VRKAQRAAIEVEEAEDEKILKVCHSILVQLRHRHSLPAIPYSFFEAMWRHLFPEYLKIFLAREKGRVVACHLVLRYKDLWTSEYCGSTVDALHGVNQLLYWESIRRAIVEGAKTFSFGRTSPSNMGLLAYKRRWNPIEENIAECVLIHDRDNGKMEFIDSCARRLFRSVLRNSPLTLNRIIGSYCYRHMG
jgi:predicted N-acyltransferase